MVERTSLGQPDRRRTEVDILLHDAIDNDQASVLRLELLHAHLPKDDPACSELKKVQSMILHNAEILNKVRKLLRDSYP
jgi:hypothetical protein